MNKLNAEITSRVNRSLVLSAIHRHPMISRTELASMTGLGASAITHILQYLITEGFVEEVSKEDSTHRGRRRILIKTRALARTVVTVDIDLDVAAASIWDLHGNEIRQISTPIKRGEDLVELVTGLLDSLRKASPDEYDRRAVIGLSIPGAVDTNSGVLLSNMYHGWTTVRLADILGERQHCHILVENNGNAAALGELHHLNVSRTSAAQSMLYLHVRESPSRQAASPLPARAAAIIEGRLLRGAGNYAGEIAEFVKGAHLSALEALLNRRPDLRKVSFEELYRQAHGGDTEIRDALTALANNLGQLLGLLTTFLDCRVVVVSFAPAVLAQSLFPEVRTAFMKHYRPLSQQPADLVLSTLAGRSPTMGLLRLAFERIFIRDTSETSILIAP